MKKPLAEISNPAHKTSHTVTQTKKNKHCELKPAKTPSKLRMTAPGKANPNLLLLLLLTLGRYIPEGV